MGPNKHGQCDMRAQVYDSMGNPRLNILNVNATLLFKILLMHITQRRSLWCATVCRTQTRNVSASKWKGHGPGQDVPSSTFGRCTITCSLSHSGRYISEFWPESSPWSTLHGVLRPRVSSKYYHSMVSDNIKTCCVRIVRHADPWHLQVHLLVLAGGMHTLLS